MCIGKTIEARNKIIRIVDSMLVIMITKYIKST